MRAGSQTVGYYDEFVHNTHNTFIQDNDETIECHIGITTWNMGLEGGG